MTPDKSYTEICFETPTGRICLPIATTGPTVPVPSPQERSLQLGEKLILSESALDVRRLLDFEAILAESVQMEDGAMFEGRRPLARTLAREGETVFGKAESATLRAGPYFFRFSKEISERIASACQSEALHPELRNLLERWCRQHPDLAGYIASLPKAVHSTIGRYREITDQVLGEFAAGGKPAIPLTCEGSTAGCAILGFLTGAAAATGNVPAAAVGVVGIGWCCG
ncbi:MAG: hypothetical protein MPW15_07570 [Candidatus Manganitrophus sp.]|nr:hypothetical protein [Candidatus Manganitrophus sp.]